MADSDVVVIGGGPAGTTTATLLARRGHRVTLLERERHPRFHIGESLLPMNLPIFEALGVLDQVRAIGVRKDAADFTGPDLYDYQVFPFAGSLGEAPDHAFQVIRSEFDALLFEHCECAGVEVLEGVRATAVRAVGDGRHEIEAVTDDGVYRRWHCRFVVDATGQDSLLARQQGWRERDRRHSAAALFRSLPGSPSAPRTMVGKHQHLLV